MIEVWKEVEAIRRGKERKDREEKGKQRKITETKSSWGYFWH